MNRQEILDEVYKIVINGREETHGKPENSFKDIAEFWSTYLGIKVQPHDVCVMMAMLKAARIKQNPNNIDNWVDFVGYPTCGVELVDDKQRENNK